MFFVKKMNYKYLYYLNFKDDSFIKLLVLFLLVFIGVVVN